MSATVTYKGATLTTATNQTRVLETEGTYLEDDITITDVTTVPTGTKNISITSNGTTTEDVTNYASASITANVPNSYSASDEGKVVSNGALVSQSSASYTENGTYDTTLVDDVTVDVPSMPYLEYWGNISVLRQGSYAQPTFPVIAGRCIVAFCPEEKEGATKEYVMLFATYNADGTRYSYGALSEEDGRSIQTNYGVTEGAEYMTPARYGAFTGWMEDYTLTAPAYIIVNSKKDGD